MPTARLVVVLSLALAACAGEPPPPREFDGALAFRYLERQVRTGFRIPGTEAHRATGDWMREELRQRADTVVEQVWTHRTAAGVDLPMRNILARFRPEAPVRLLFLAHWDTRPRADAAGSSDPTAPVPGANDGASGVAVLLAMADALQRRPPTVGIDLLLVDGEDYGDFTDTPGDVLIGSRYYAANLPPGPRPRFAVLLDMVGDKDLQLFQEGNSLTGAPQVVEEVWSTARMLGYDRIFIAQPRHTVVDDHVELQKVGIAAIDVIDFDYPAWHTPGDDLTQVAAASLQVVGDVMMAVIRRAR